MIKEKIDIIYIDPPYETNFAYEALKIILDRDLITQESTIIVETDREELEKQIENLNVKIVSKRKYGRVYLIFLKRVDEI